MRGAPMMGLVFSLEEERQPSLQVRELQEVSCLQAKKSRKGSLPEPNHKGTQISHCHSPEL